MDVVIDVLQGRKQASTTKPRTEDPPDDRKPPRPKCGIKALADYMKRFLLRALAFVLIFSATFGPPCFYVSVNLLLEPGLATFTAGFQPSVCIVAASNVLRGTSNCSWSSCRQGCTSHDLYRCWQVVILSLNSAQQHQVFNRSTGGQMAEDTDNITYSTKYAELNHTSVKMTPNNVESSEKELTGMLLTSPIDQKTHVGHSEISQRDLDEGFVNASWPEAELIKLRVNVKGCGYDPCDVWWRTYSRLGTTFACHVSADRSLAIPHIDYKFAAMQVALGILPLALTLNAVVVMYRLYCRKGSGNSVLKLSQNSKQSKQKRKLAQTQLILQMEMEQKHLPESKFDSLLLMTVAANSKVAPDKQFAGSRQVWKGDDDNKKSNLSSDQTVKSDVPRRWQEMAKLTTRQVHVSTVTSTSDDTGTKLKTKS